MISGARANPCCDMLWPNRVQFGPCWRVKFKMSKPCKTHPFCSSFLVPFDNQTWQSNKISHLEIMYFIRWMANITLLRVIPTMTFIHFLTGKSAHSNPSSFGDFPDIYRVWAGILCCARSKVPNCKRSWMNSRRWMKSWHHSGRESRLMSLVLNLTNRTADSRKYKRKYGSGVCMELGRGRMGWVWMSTIAQYCTKLIWKMWQPHAAGIVHVLSDWSSSFPRLCAVPDNSWFKTYLMCCFTYTISSLFFIIIRFTYIYYRYVWHPNMIYMDIYYGSMDSFWLWICRPSMIGGLSGTRQEQDNLTMEVDLCQKKLERVGLPSTVMDHDGPCYYHISAVFVWFYAFIIIHNIIYIYITLHWKWCPYSDRLSA